MGSLESVTPERVGEGGRRTLEEPWAASAHSDETFAAPLPAAHRLQRSSSHAYHRAGFSSHAYHLAAFSSHAYHRAVFSSHAYHRASRPVVTPCSSTLPLVLIVGVLGVGASATAVS